MGRGGWRPGAGRKPKRKKNQKLALLVEEPPSPRTLRSRRAAQITNEKLDIKLIIDLTRRERLAYYLNHRISPGLVKYVESVLEGIEREDVKIRDSLWYMRTDIELFRAHYLSREHVEWQANAIRDIQRAIRKGLRKIFLIAPRRHGKTTIAIDLLLHHLVFNKNARIKYITKASKLAKEKISPVRQHLENNQLLIEDFGPFYHPSNLWTNEAFTIIRPKRREDPSVEALGLDSAYTGKNCTFMIIDDPVDAKMSSDAMMKAHDKIFGETRNILEPDAIVIAIMTRKAPEDIAACMLGKCPFCEADHSQEWHIVDYGRAIMEGDFQHEGPDTYDLIKDASGTIVDVAIHANYKVLWEKRWDIRKLIKTYYGIGEAFFLREYQNDPTALEGRRFKTAWYNYYDEHNFFVDTFRCITVDLALSDNPAADYSAIVGVGYDQVHNRFYVERTYALHKPLAEVRQQIDEYAREFQPDLILVEAIGMFAPLVQNWQALLPYNVEFIEHKQTGKVERITAAIQPALMNKRLWFKREHQDLITELKSFPLSAKDHILDALEQFIRWIQENAFYAFDSEVID